MGNARCDNEPPRRSHLSQAARGKSLGVSGLAGVPLSDAGRSVLRVEREIASTPGYKTLVLFHSPGFAGLASELPL